MSRRDKFIRLHWAKGGGIISIRRSDLSLAWTSSDDPHLTQLILRNGKKVDVLDDMEVVLALVEGRKRVRDKG